jgi:hypothetical protein
MSKLKDTAPRVGARGAAGSVAPTTRESLAIDVSRHSPLKHTDSMLASSEVQAIRTWAIGQMSGGRDELKEKDPKVL